MSASKQGDLFGAMAPASPGEPPPTTQPTLKEILPPPPLPSEGPAPAKVPAWRRTEPAASKAAVPQALTVSQLTAQVKDLIEPRFSRVLVRGEVSNFRGANARGHLYFALKDEGAAVDVKVWAGQAQRLKFKLKDGLAVVIEGSLDVYAPQGRYSLIAQRVEPEGVGAQALAFEQLKQRLAAEGLIGEGRTRAPRPVPFLPRRIGVVTSITGAALRDFLKVLHRRHPRLSVLVADARMQGDDAVVDVRRALRWLARTDVDVIVVTRGGGSVEDLWTFNEEGLVRAVWACPVPVVSAVGHEIDTTLCDLVADVRAPTPSAAAELLAPSLVDLEAQLATIRARLVRGLERRIAHERAELRGLAAELGDPRRELSRQRLALGEAADRMAGQLRRRQRAASVELRELGARLQRARPQAQLQSRRAQLLDLKDSLARLLHRRLRAERETLGRLSTALARHSPVPRLEQGHTLLVRQRQQLPVLVRARVRRERDGLRALAARLEALSPLAVLSRGYALAQRPDGTLVRSAAGVRPGDSLTLRLGGGDSLEARVMQVKPAEK